MTFRRRCSLTDIEAILAAVVSDDAAASPSPRPPNYEAVLEIIYRHASYVVVHGQQAYRRKMTDVPDPPTRRHLVFAELANLIRTNHDLTNAQIAHQIGMPRARFTAILRAAAGKYHTGIRKRPSATAIKRLRAVLEYPFHFFEPLSHKNR